MRYINSKERRKEIKNILFKNGYPIKGGELAKNFNVTRQVIVKDIAILRAEGFSIIATPEGYVFEKNIESNIKKIIAVSHKKDDIYNELFIIIKFGGIIHDIIIEHPLYGEIKANLKIKNLVDLEYFIDKLKNNEAEPLSKLTSGVHLHTIETMDKNSMKSILNELFKEGYLIKDN